MSLATWALRRSSTATTSVCCPTGGKPISQKRISPPQTTSVAQQAGHLLYQTRHWLLLCCQNPGMQMSRPLQAVLLLEERIHNAKIHPFDSAGRLM